jgi:hypothetical protein
MHSEESQELLSLHALDILAPPEAALIEADLAVSPSLASELSQLRSIAHSLAYTPPLFSLDSSLKDRLFQKIKVNNSEESNREFKREESEKVVDRASSEIPPIIPETIPETIHQETYPEIPLEIPPEHSSKYKSPIPLISNWRQQAAQAQWQPFLVEGISLSRLALDRQARRVTYFIRAEAGVKFPNHCHADREEIIMLEGDLTIDGQCYYPGDYIYSAPNSIHQPVTKDGCLAIIRTSLDDQILA